VLPQHKVEQKKNKKKEMIMMIVKVKNVCGRQVRTGKGRPAWLQAAADALISGRKSETHYTNSLNPSTQDWSMHARKGVKKKDKQINTSQNQSISNRACGGGPKKA
jgi:hypothetical protein